MSRCLWHYLLLNNIKKLGRKVSLEIMVQFYKIYSTSLPQLEVYVFNFRRPGFKKIATRKKMALCCGKMTKNYDFFLFPFNKILYIYIFLLEFQVS